MPFHILEKLQYSRNPGRVVQGKISFENGHFLRIKKLHRVDSPFRFLRQDAEEIFFGDVTSGAHNDIEQATRIARLMVTELGMSDLGPIKYDSGDNAVFLGRDYSQLSNTHSGQIAFEIDQQVRKIIDEAHTQATEIIMANKDKLEVIAQALLENETLNNEQIESLFHHGHMPETFDGSSDVPPQEQVTPRVDPDDDLLDEMK